MDRTAESTNNKNEKIKRNSQAKEVWRRFKKNKPAILGLYIAIILMLMFIFADVIVDKELVTKIDVKNRLQWPNAQHWFGTDQQGRDAFARVIHGSRPSLSISIVATAIFTVVGTLVGGAVGYYGERFDNIVMRICDVIQSIPGLLLLLVIISVLGTSLTNMLIALSIGGIPGTIRSIRSVVLNVADSEFVQSAKAYGTSDFRIIVKHILPNVVGPIIVSTASSISDIILAAAALSFLGFGVQPPDAEWGLMVSDSREYMRTSSYLMFAPGLFIVLASLSANLIGDGLRDALDPRMKN